MDKAEFKKKWEFLFQPRATEEWEEFESDLDKLLEGTLESFTEYVKYADNMPDRELIKQFLLNR